MGEHETMRILSLREWIEASIDQRSEWLKAGCVLDSLSQTVLDYAMAFKRAGASISDDAMLQVRYPEGI